MKKIPVTFSTQFDLLIGQQIAHVGSGSAPNDGDSVLLQNCEIETGSVTAKMKEECREAWESGTIEAFVRKNFFPVGRPEGLRFWREID